MFFSQAAQRFDALFCQNFGTSGQDDFRGPFRDTAKAFGRRMHRCHALAFGIKGNFVHKRVGLFPLLQRQRLGQHVLLDGCLHGTVSTTGKGKKGKQFWAIYERMLSCQGHFIFRKRTCLIRADDRGTSQGFHSRKSADNRLFTCHALNSQGKHDCHKGGQTFRDSSHTQTYGGHKHFQKRLFFYNSQKENKNADGKGQKT